MWRNSGLAVRLGPVDWRAVLPLLLFFLHIRLWTLYLAIGAIVFFVVIEHFGWTIPVAVRTARVALSGRVKRARSWWLVPRLPAKHDPYTEQGY